MCRFIRFHTQIRDSEISDELGIFVALGELERRRRLTADEQDRVNEVFEWFNEYLRVPRLSPEYWRARFWFRDSAQPMVCRLWDLVAILRERNVRVELLTTSDPGIVVYSDRHQVAALPRPSRRKW